jgi:hypothetical protein
MPAVKRKRTRPEPLSVEHFYQLYKSRSTILNQDTNTKTPPRSSRPVFIADLAGLKAEHHRYVDKTLDEFDLPMGRVPRARLERQTFVYNYAVAHNFQDHKKVTSAHMDVKNAEKLNRMDGFLKCLELESRTLASTIIKLQKAHDMEQAKKQHKAKQLGNVRTALVTVGQGRDRRQEKRIITVDLRDVIYKNDKPVFADDGSSVEEYLEEVKKERKAKVSQKQAKAKTKDGRKRT